MRGERSAGGPPPWACLGSSPHTRGTRADRVLEPGLGRFIPAYAGNACPATAWAGLPTVHPRIRGERVTHLPRCRNHHGSSPHTRGTRQASVGMGARPRFIPAYAGNAHRLLLKQASQTVHPRIRGERAKNNRAISKKNGSSPHTRGTLTARPIFLRGLRFIPAYAGNASRHP